LGIIGCGYWGPNLVRNFSSLSNCKVKQVSDLKPGRLDYIKKEFPFVHTSKDYKDIIHNKNIEAICISTPVSTHKDFALEALMADKHVFVEKPLTNSIKDAEILVNTSKKLNKKLAVGHVFQYSPAVRKIKSLIKAGVIGDVLHITSSRINLGPPESEVDVIWDLGPHDFSIILHLLEEIPIGVNCKKESYNFNTHKTNGLIDNAHIDLSFKSGITAHIHLSWLSSNKMRLMQIFGTEGTIVYDEMLALDGKVKLYGKGIDNRIKNEDTDARKLSYQSGDVHIIQLEQHEPLRLECEEFINSIISNKPLVNDGLIGLEVVKLLEASSNLFQTT
jgi:predicted dehydrogenase